MICFQVFRFPRLLFMNDERIRINKAPVIVLMVYGLNIPKWILNMYHNKYSEPYNTKGSKHKGKHELYYENIIFHNMVRIETIAKKLHRLFQYIHILVLLVVVFFHTRFGVEQIAQ